MPDNLPLVFACRGMILDPFAGGSVRGIVASKLGRQYIGHELRQEQVDANRAQGSELCGDDEHRPSGYAATACNRYDLRRCAGTWCLAARRMPTWGLQRRP